MITKNILNRYFNSYYKFGLSKIPQFFNSPSNIQKSKKLFSRCEPEAILDQSNIQSFYQEVGEQRKQFIMFGRSNVGKSSLINALVGKNIATVSNTPGKTQKLHTYKLPDNTFLIDAPGFGFTSGVQKKKVDSWKRLIQLYLRKGCSRQGLCLVDSEHGFKESDLSLFQYLDNCKKQFMVVFTKCDKQKLGLQKLQSMQEKYELIYKVMHFTSAKTNFGIQQLRRDIALIMEQPTIF